MAAVAVSADPVAAGVKMTFAEALERVAAAEIAAFNAFEQEEAGAGPAALPGKGKRRGSRRRKMRRRRKAFVRASVELEVPHWHVRRKPRYRLSREGRDPQLVADATTLVAFADDDVSVRLDTMPAPRRIRLANPVFRPELDRWCPEDDKGFDVPCQVTYRRGPSEAASGQHTRRRRGPSLAGLMTQRSAVPL